MQKSTLNLFSYLDFYAEGRLTSSIHVVLKNEKLGATSREEVALRVS